MNQDFNTPDALPQGTQIGQDYTILRVLGQGGFGITYLAHDEMMGGEVVIKESMPGDFAARDRDTLRLTPRLRQEENYTWARDRFLDEARLLHKLHHPNIVPVTRAFAALNTAYYVMPHVGATELGEAVRNAPDGRSEAYLAPLLRQLLDALTYLHGENLLHRDLKPSNILMSEKGVPIIIDFGSARATVSSRTHTMLESPGYTPIEQVQSHGNVGPWTDLYSLGATFYRLITGDIPPRSIDRHFDATIHSPLTERADLQKHYSHRFLAGIDKALAIHPADRWQTAEEWANALPAPKPQVAPVAVNEAPPASPNAATAPVVTQKENSTPERQRQRKRNTLWMGLVALMLFLVMLAGAHLISDDGAALRIKHDELVNCVTFSPDGKYLATGSWDYTARITEVATGNTIREIWHGADVRSVAFSPDGRYLATGSRDTTARITEVATGNTIREIKHDHWVESVSFSPDGRYLATGSADDTARVTEVATGNTIREIKYANTVLSVAFSPDGKFLATGSSDKTARITEVATGNTIREIKHREWVHGVAFSPDGRYLATGSDDNTARITEVATGNIIREIQHSDDVRSVVFSPDGRYLATGSGDKAARITEVATGNTIREIKHGHWVSSVAFSPDGRYLATGSVDNTARIYELNETAK